MLFAIPSASFGCINAMLHQTFLFLGQLWQLFEVSQILEFLRPQVLASDLSPFWADKRPVPCWSKLTMSLVNVLLKFQTVISEICQNFC